MMGTKFRIYRRELPDGARQRKEENLLSPLSWPLKGNKNAGPVSSVMGKRIVGCVMSGHGVRRGNRSGTVEATGFHLFGIRR